MSQTANYDSSVRIRRLKQQALAAYRNDNPGKPEFSNSQGSAIILQERRVGQINRVFQPVAANPAINVPACGCDQPVVQVQGLCPEPITFFEDIEDSSLPISPFTVRFVYEFLPVNNVGTLIFSIIPSNTSFLATLIAPGRVAFDTNTADYTAVITFTESGCVPVSAQRTAPCFLAGAQIALADGTVKVIEDVAIGDLVVGAFGEINEVLALHRPLLGSAQMMTINGSHSTTAHHPHVGADRRFYCADVERVLNATYGLEHEVIGLNGPEMRFLHGLSADKISKLVYGTLLKTVNGPVPVSDIEYINMPADTQLYNLVVGGSHTYTVDTYAVTGWPRMDDFDYDTWTAV